MKYNEWEDRGMYAPPMFSTIESGETREERVWKAIELAKDPDGMKVGIRATYRDYPKSTREHIGGWRIGNPYTHNTQWTFCATMYHEFGLSENESLEAIRLIRRHFPGLRTCLNDIIEKEIRRWQDGHPSD